MRVCNEDGCGNVQPERKCEEHRRTRERTRGTRQQRGYDKRYDADRKRWGPKVAAGVVICWSCGLRISPLVAWQHGHCEDDPNVIHGPEHALCNQEHKGKHCPHPAHIT